MPKNQSFDKLKDSIEKMLNLYFCNDIILTGQIKPLKFAIYSKSKGSLISDYMGIRELYCFGKGLEIKNISDQNNISKREKGNGEEID